MLYKKDYIIHEMRFFKQNERAMRELWKRKERVKFFTIAIQIINLPQI